MASSSDGHDLTTNLADMTQAQRDALKSRLGAEEIPSRWTGFELTVDDAYEPRVTTLIQEIRSGQGTAPPAGPPPPAFAYPPPAYAPPAYPPPAYPPPAYPPPGAGYGGMGPPATSGYPQPGTAYGYPPGPSPYGGYGGYGYVMGPRTNSNAITALVLAIAAWAVCPVIPAVIALVIAGNAKREIAASGGAETGEQMVLAARIIAWLNVGAAAAVVVFYLVLLLAVGTSSGF